MLFSIQGEVPLYLYVNCIFTKETTGENSIVTSTVVITCKSSKEQVKSQAWNKFIFLNSLSHKKK